jgi:hypothetical protein
MTIRNVQPPDDRNEVPADIGLFSRIEGLVGEERALLVIPDREWSHLLAELPNAYAEALT